MASNPQSSEDGGTPVNAGEATTNTPSSLNLDENAQFRNLNKRLDELADQVSRIAKPKEFRLADIIQLSVIVAAFLVAVLTAMGLKDRIDDLAKSQSATEARVSSQVSAGEGRIDTKLDRLDDRFTRLDERTATLEGARGVHGTDK